MGVLTGDERQQLADTILFHDGSTPLCDLDTYFAYYEGEVYSRDQSKQQILNPGFKSHTSIAAAVKKLQNDPNLTREQFKSHLFPSQDEFEDRVKEETIRRIVRIGFMLDCGSGNKDDEDEDANFHLDDFVAYSWASQECFETYVLHSFKLQGKEDNPATSQREFMVDAWRIPKRGIKIVLTDTLSDHLWYNSRDKTLLVFRHIAYLRALTRQSSRRVPRSKTAIPVVKSDISNITITC